MMRLLFLFLMTINSAYATQYPIHVGSTRVVIDQVSYGCGKAFVHVHQNETTALKAARTVAKSRGGSVLTLIHPGGRNIVFYLKKKRYEFDPNRIYTDVGIKKTLTTFGCYSPQAHREVKALANKIKSLLPNGKIIAVHNNKSYSLHNYLPGKDMAKDARALHVSHCDVHRNFFLATKQLDFTRFRQLNFNSIWQSTNATDDGSLSVYLGHHRYVNVEAGFDQLKAQIKMLRYA